MPRLQDDISKYLKGELSPSEMHALEKRALDDPFLADALEGGGSINADHWDNDLKHLQQALQKKTQSEKQGFNWAWTMRIAAGLILLVLSTFIINRLLNFNDLKESLALNDNIHHESDPEVNPNEAEQTTEEQHEIEQEPVKEESSTPLKDEIKSEPHSVAAPKSSKPIAPSSLSQPEKADEDLAEIIIEPSEESPVIQEPLSHRQENRAAGVAAKENDKKRLPAEEEMDNINMTDVAPASTQGYYNESKKRKKESIAESSSPAGAIRSFSVMDSLSIRKVTGQVVDAEDGLPIPGVNVTTNDYQRGTVTNLDGNFELDVPSKTENIVFSFTGLETKEITLQNNLQVASQSEIPLTIKMTPDVSALEEIVVIGYAEKIREFDGTKWELAHPAEGKKAYEKYLEKNLVYPELAIKNEVEGKVSVQFVVQANGQMSDFRVVKSLGFGCDEELVRLIREGPGWKPTLRNDDPVPSKAKVKMKFTIPKRLKK